MPPELPGGSQRHLACLFICPPRLLIDPDDLDKPVLRHYFHRKSKPQRDTKRIKHDQEKIDHRKRVHLHPHRKHLSNHQKWLYSDKEIFLRELVSNGVDAIHKLQHINLVEGLKISDEYKINISIDKDASTLTIADNGIGMTMEEVRKYINQIAFSSAEEFIEKYKTDDKDSQIIGHFGLGFYSSFMVANKVEIRTRSYQQDEKGAHWICEGSTSYELEEMEKEDRGTEIVLHLTDDETEFLETTRVREVLTKYCNFLPVSISLEGEVVNDRNPLWTKSPSEVTDEEYKEFYKNSTPSQKSRCSGFI